MHLKSHQQMAEQQEGRKEPRVLQWQGPQPLPPIPNINYAIFILKQCVVHKDAVAVVSRVDSL